jgi:hypothetical protein
MNAAKKNHIGLRLLCLVRETEGVTDIICDPLDLLDLVVVSENDRVALPLQFENLLLDGGQRREFALRMINERFIVENGGHGWRIARSAADAKGERENGKGNEKRSQELEEPGVRRRNSIHEVILKN